MDDNEENSIDKIKREKIIIDHRYEIIKLCKSYEDDKLINFLRNVSNDDPVFYPILNGGILGYCTITLYEHGVKSNDIDLFAMMLQDGINCRYASRIIDYVMIYNTNPISILNMFIDNGGVITKTNMTDAFKSTNLAVIHYLIDNNYDITEAWNIYLQTACNIYDDCQLNVELLKIVSTKVDIEVKLTNLIISCINKHNLDAIDYLFELYSNHNLNQYLGMSCRPKREEILIWFLKKGADIHTIKPHYLSEVSIETIKILIDHNYKISTDLLKEFLIRHFVFCRKIDDIYCLLKFGANLQWIFDYENQKEKEQIEHEYYNVYSPLEFIIYKGYFDKVKFIAENCFESLKPHIDRLFIIAATNGQTEIVSYLYDLGAKLNDFALVNAVYMGQLQTIIFLLKLGMNLLESWTNLKLTYNLFIIAMDGFMDGYSRDSITYMELIDNTVFKNHVHNYGYDHQAILRLLVDYNIPLGNAYELGPFCDAFYDIKIFTYFMQTRPDVDMNTVFGSNFKGEVGRTFLDGAIIYRKLDVMELLLNYGVNTKTLNAAVTETINENEPIKIMLLKYGVCLS